MIYPIYKAIKQRLNAVAPVFFYVGQYAKGKENTSYKVPAIYIQMPSSNQLHYFGKKLLAAKDVPITIHYISYAPFKNQDNPVQDSAIQAHENIVLAIDKLLNGWHVVDGNNKLLTQQFIIDDIDALVFKGENVITKLGYKTEVYSRHLQTSI